ncbi:hypothetical protein fh0823_25480 [Francisella halioticida]|uniref:Uncharacterized protein n=1 Tax=Francisella halioticida TaxID=549298 RepID=A0ABM6LXS5_9GAMM|nr:hypothetical protein [Francisella halioticida]ASG67260.1 hypothetical protein CDV26_01630 [Francisella halioticida]BCD92409.1 hypothetical protein fh0823_25480 [Francisella halioticida]
MKNKLNNSDKIPMRKPEVVMNIKRLGSMHQSRLSFARRLVRRMFKHNWKVSITTWNLSPEGFGSAIYRLDTKNGSYHLVIFSNKIRDDERNDRVIAEKWDVTFALVQGEVDDNLYKDLYNNVPKQEYGRNSNKILVLARANKSLRIFDHILQKLQSGEQPNPELLSEVGYILRTTAVYGNGKFGISDFKLLENNPDFNLTFSAQMFSVYLLRQFSLDWVHFISKEQARESAVTIDKEFQRYIGVGNATGLGMAPYLINHPCVIDQWLSERELALTLISNLDITIERKNKVISLIRKALQYLSEVVTIDEQQNNINAQAVKDIDTIIPILENIKHNSIQWGSVLKDLEFFEYESQEILISCLLEVYPEHSDPHALNMKSVDQTLELTPSITIAETLKILENRYAWAINTDFTKLENSYWFWYISEDKEEPRLGVRGKDLGEDKELPLDIARQVSNLYKAISSEHPETKLVQFLIDNPPYSPIARRVCTMGNRLMGDIQMNILAKDMLPIDLLRCKLSFLGATKFDPRSDRWVRVTFFQGAPLLNEINDDNWLFPLCPNLH